MNRMPLLALLGPGDSVEIEPSVPEAESSLEFLQAVYSDPGQPMTRRMRAAIAALPFEHPKLAVVASMHANEGFAAKLEEAIARSRIYVDARPEAVANEKENSIGATR